MQPPNLYTQKLASSGIGPAEAKKLGYTYLTAEETEQLGHRKIPALKIPYYTLQGKQTNFYRIRYLETTKRGFAKQTSAKDQRYDQPTAITTELYIPPLLDWQKYLATTNPIFITEGELKAACATARGYPTIALGGVWNFCSRKKGVQLLPIFDDLKLEDRTVYIVYDSDAVSNPMVIQAENELCKQLTAKRCPVKVVRLPNVGDNKKTGLDDFLLSDRSDEWEDVLHAAAPYALAEHLLKLNEEVIYVENPSLVIRRRDGYKMGVPTFKNEVYGHKNFLDLSGEKPKKVSTAQEWVKWEGRASVNGFTYQPGAAEFVVERNHTSINMWKPLPVEPKKGDIEPWKKLMDYVFKGEPESRRWFECWLAYPLQHLGTKMFTAAVLWSVETGTGKTLIGHTLQRLYGENSIMIRKRDLLSGNNSFAENKQFVLGEEITGDERRGMVDELKGLITNEEMRINIKYVPEYSIKSCANYYFTSNNPDAFFIDETDRRFFIHEITGDPLPEQWYTGTYDPWYKSEEGAAALMHYFMHLKLDGFNPVGRAPMTRAKEEMIESSRSALANWVYNFRQNPEKILQMGQTKLEYTLYSTEDLLRLFDPEGKSRVGVRGMAVELKRAKVNKACGGMGCRTVHGQLRLWVVKGAEKYCTMQPRDVAQAYDKEREMDTKAAKFTREGRK